MDKDELSLDELENVNVTSNNQANYKNAMNNKDLYRQKSIEELEALKEKIVTEKETEKKNTR